MDELFGARHVEGFEQSRIVAVMHIAIEEQQRRNSGSRQRRAREWVRKASISGRPMSFRWRLSWKNV